MPGAAGPPTQDAWEGSVALLTAGQKGGSHLGHAARGQLQHPTFYLRHRSGHCQCRTARLQQQHCDILYSSTHTLEALRQLQRVNL